jgi:hypothetical protein
MASVGQRYVRRNVNPGEREPEEWIQYRSSAGVPRRMLSEAV